MGVVYRATQLTLGRLVAVKAIAPALAADASYRERFKRESQLAAMIDHPNIIPVYEAGDAGGTLYLIMRWVDGTDLREMISAGRLAPARAVRLLRPVASALGAAHKQGLVHRDVKPANVLIARGDEEREEHVYLTDFGIARRGAAQSAITRTGMFVGTVDYMAPERLIGGKGDATSDIYALGCMLFEALTGRAPYDRPDDAAKAFAHVNDPVPLVRALVPEVPERLDAVVAKAMAKHPRERFGSAGELTQALDQALAEPAAAEPIVPAETVLSPEETLLSAAPTEPTGPPDAPTEPAAPAVTPTAMAATATQLSPGAPAGQEAAVPPPQRRRRLALWATVVVLLGALAAAAVVVFALGTGTSGPKAAPSEVKTMSPGLTKLQTIPLGGVASDVTVGQQGEIWVSLPDSGTVARITADGAVTRLAIGGRPGQIAAGPAGIWVAGSSQGALVRLDEQTGKVLATSSLNAAPTALTVDRDDGSAWVGDATGSVVHVDQGGGVSGQPAHVSPPVLGLGWGEGWVWAVNGTTTGLARISADGSGGTMNFDTRPGPVSVTFNQGVWTAHSSGNVTRFDPRPSFLRVNTDVSVAPSLGRISAVEAQASVWAISQQSQALYRISTQPSAPVTGTAVLTSSPVGLAVAESSVWVATADGTITQIGFS
jgi:streptogramin lyase